MKVSAENKTKFPVVSEGVHMAVCHGVIDLGTQQTEWQGHEKHVRKVLLCWELPDERIERDGESIPRVVSARYTASIGEKANLRKVLESWRGKAFTQEELGGFEIRNLLGVGCQIQIIHKKKGEQTYANVTSVMALPKGMKSAVSELPQLWFSFDEIDKSNPAIPEEIPEWIQKVITQSDEWKEFSQVPEATAGEPQDASEEVALPF